MDEENQQQSQQGPDNDAQANHDTSPLQPHMKHEEVIQTSSPSPTEVHTLFDDPSAELERQARETVRVFRETAGDLGERVRQVLGRASSLWDEAHPGAPGESAVTAEDALHGRTLARRWTERDFLVDPDLADAMTIQRVHSTNIWRIELRERGETRSLVDAHEPYRGLRPASPGPVLPVWDYDFPATPEIESGERRERLAGTDVIAACSKCNGSGHRPCATCEGRGFVQCPICHGRARIPCHRCRGRGRIADPKAERRARASKSYLQVQAERLRQNASEQLLDFAERLRQDYAIPLPPTGHLAPLAPASGETLPCPDCVNGSIPCTCGTGKLVCTTCNGTSVATCTACDGTGKVLQHRELVRRFDTHISQRTLPLEDNEMAQWLTNGMVRKGTGEEVWQGSFDAISVTPPASVPPTIWTIILETVKENRERVVGGENGEEQSDPADERRVISRRVSLVRIPVTRVEYTFAGQPFAFIVVGRTGAERFWAQVFPPRWSRVNRFLKALSRDLQREASLAERTQQQSSSITGGLTNLEDFRARRASNGTTGENVSDQTGQQNGDMAVHVEEVREGQDTAQKPGDTTE